MVPFEDANVEAYRLLLRIEVVVREVLRISLEEIHGARWQRQLLKEMRSKIHESQAEEHRRRQFDFIRLGPLYYLTLGELIPLLRQRVAQQAVQRLGGNAFIEQVENIFAPRNAVAHSRDVSAAGIAAIRAIYLQIENSVGGEELSTILQHPDVGISPERALPSILEWAIDVFGKIEKLAATCPPCEEYSKAETQFWWGMHEVREVDYQLLERCVKDVERYNVLPKGIGSAATRQRFVESSRLNETLQKAIQTLKGK